MAMLVIWRREPLARGPSERRAGIDQVPRQDNRQGQGQQPELEPLSGYVLLHRLGAVEEINLAS